MNSGPRETHPSVEKSVGGAFDWVPGDMHELSNRDSKIYTGWSHGSMSPMDYRITTASEIDSQLSGD
jgi:hypothetical protein